MGNAIDIFDRDLHVTLILCRTPTDFLKCLIEIQPLVTLAAKDDLDILKNIAAKLFREFHGHHWYSDCKKCAE